MTKPANLVIDRAMRAAFKAWQDDMVSRGQTSALNAKFDDIAPRDRRLIELQCRAAIASLKTDESKKAMYGNYRCDEMWVDLTSYQVLDLWIDAALKP